MRRIYIGDIQGCREELELLLEAVKFDPARDRLHSVGDAVNRGPDSAGCLRLLKQLGAVMVLGNHELHWIDVAAKRRHPGKRDTLAALEAAADRDDLLEWVRTRPLLHAEADVVMVHAGLHPAWRDDALAAKAAELRAALDDAIARDLSPWKLPEIAFVTSVRFCDEQGREPDEDDPPPPPFRPWDAFWSGERVVVCGHWARRGLVVGPKLRALDSGCVYGKQLTAWIAEDDRIVQVPARRAYSLITA
ncbi:MAG: diadenosine tetraphosphatase [Planctomycetes bacterium]|nr:diadenosine tetraphosphatase [Planctomycetota bacterium]